MFTVAFAHLALSCRTVADDVRPTLERYATAVRTYDVAELDRLFHRDYVEVSPLGEVDSRDRTLGFYRTKPPVTPTAIRVEDVQARRVGDGVVIAIFREVIAITGREMAFRVTTTLVREGKDWKLVQMNAITLRSGK